MKPGEDQLNQLLKRATVPDRSRGYWETFPGRVIAGLTEAGAEAAAGWSFWWWVGGLVIACLIVSLGLVFWSRGSTDPQMQYVKIYREMAALFPHQLRGIVCDEQGVHLELADKPELPAAPPVLLTVCAKAQPCLEIITFSGQQVNVDGDTCDVLTDAGGHILVVGRRFVWSSEKGRDLGRLGPEFKMIEAQRL